MVNAGAISVKYVKTEDMLADGLTKPLPRDSHWTHLGAIELQQLSEPPPMDSPSIDHAMIF